MSKIVFWIGEIVGATAVFSFFVLGLAFLESKWRNEIWPRIAERRAERREEKAIKKGGTILAVKVPSKDYYYTPVAYVWRDSRLHLGITLLHSSFLKRLPKATPTFSPHGNEQWLSVYPTVGDILDAHRHYVNRVYSLHKEGKI